MCGRHFAPDLGAVVQSPARLLQLLIDAGVVAADNQERMSGLLASLNQEIDRYKKEKQEILRGSSAVGEGNWVLEQDGERGQIKGALEWEAEAEALGEVVKEGGPALLRQRLLDATTSADGEEN